jgi:hypothetical protein
MTAKFLIAAAGLVLMAAPVLASTPYSDPFSTPSNDQATPPAPAPEMGNKDSYMSPFADHLRQSPTDSDMRPADRKNRNNLLPPRMDASGVPDPRI